MGDTVDEIVCPVCNKPMKKIYLEDRQFNVDICDDGCGGIFLDNREFKKIDEKKEDITPIVEAVKNKKFQKADAAKQIVCPSCGHVMIKNHSSHLKTVEINECYNCGGKFFNYDDLIKIRNEFETEEERIEAFNKYSYSVIADADSEFSRRKTFGTMLNDIVKNYKEFN